MSQHLSKNPDGRSIGPRECATATPAGDDLPAIRTTAHSQRRACVLRGIVQGVGFRPFVARLAALWGLSGFVRNQAGDVSLEIEGPQDALDQFAAALLRDLPPLARLDAVAWNPLNPTGVPGFSIEASIDAVSSEIWVSPDIATCDDCLTELFDPTNRRYHYPFLNCTNCGPRLTIIRETPYDRSRTTMSAFEMCAACQREYEDPNNRRYHAQPNACPACGPRLQLVDAHGRSIPTSSPLDEFVAAITAGRIGALKGLGGYHLVCDAGSATSAAELRRRKHRDDRPFAVMVENVEQAFRLCHINAAERALLGSRQRPIVLLRRRTDHDFALRSRQFPQLRHDLIAPGNPWLGLMLPYTPLHHLLLRAVDGRPMLMTSGNRSGQPIAYNDDDALARLGDIADIFLSHNRPIQLRCDDSVTRVIAGREAPIRLSRGVAPVPRRLPIELAVPALAVGGQDKGCLALGQGHRAILSHHLGDLDDFSAWQAFERDVRRYENLFGIRPEVLVHDLHPDYASTRYAQRRAQEEGLRLVAVQHHHAHIAGCLAEHSLTGPVIGVAFDGTGYGTDGKLWGGEFLVADLESFQRKAHLRYIGMPGGAAAIREPWRMAAAYLLDAGCDLSVLSSMIPRQNLAIIERMFQRGVNTPETSSMGRLFDAVAALAGLRMRVSYEGQAAIEWEWLADDGNDATAYPFLIEGNASPRHSAGQQIDVSPMIRAIVEDIAAGRHQSMISRRFHVTIAEIILRVCQRLRTAENLNRVVLSGGVFLNALLLWQATERLTANGFDVFRPETIPVNDGGLCYGQLAIAACRAEENASH